METILEDYPNLTVEDVRAALEFGRELSSYESHPYDAVA